MYHCSNLASRLMRGAIVAAFLMGPVIGSAAAQEDAPPPAKPIKAIAENLGYAPEDRQYPNGDPYYRTQIVRGGTTYYVDFEQGQANGRDYVWLTMDMNQVPEEQDVPRDVLEAMAARNYRAHQAYIGFNPDTRWIRIKIALQDDDIKPAQVRRAYDEIVDFADTNKDLWNYGSWSTAQPPETGGN